MAERLTLGPADIAESGAAKGARQVMEGTFSESETPKPSKRVERLSQAAAEGLAVLVTWRLGPEAGLMAAAGIPYVQGYLENAIAEFREDGTDRVTRMLGYACEESGEDPEQFATRASENEETRLFTAKAVAAAFSTAWEPKVRALGRLLAKGLIDVSGGVIPLRTYVLPAMAELEQFDVALLNVLVSYEPDHTVGFPPVRPYEDLGGPWGSQEGWSVGRRTWTVSEVSRFRPQLASTLPGLLGALQRHGLAVQNDVSSEIIERALKELEDNYNSALGRTINAGAARPVPMKAPLSVPHVERTWSPTELGDQVLQFYREAGADDTEDQ